MNEDLFLADGEVDILVELQAESTDPDQDNIGSLLRKWGIPEQVIYRFQENEIKSTQLRHLSDDILKELCPPIGHRILLKSKLDEHFTGNTDTETTLTTKSITSETIDDLDNISIENLFSTVRPPFPDFDIKTLLSTSPCGNSIITYYNLHKTLTNKHRNQLVDIIVRHIFTRVVNQFWTYLPDSRFLRMTSSNLLELLNLPAHILEACKPYGVGRRTLDDPLFKDDAPLRRLGVCDLDDETLCHEVVKTTCSIPGCVYTAESLLDYESHYNSSHRYACATCKKVLPSPHLLDLHIQENHDSFFAVMSEKKPSFCCYIEECKSKFKTSVERKEHCVEIHKLPKNFRFDCSAKKSKSGKKPTTNNTESMEFDSETKKQNPFMLTTSKTRAFPKYTGKKFTGSKGKKPKATQDVDMDAIVDDLKSNLPK